MDLIASLLVAHRAAFRSSTLFKRWKRDNPIECAAVEAFWDGGVRPSPRTPFGAAYCLAGEAYRAAVYGAARVMPYPLGDRVWL